MADVLVVTSKVKALFAKEELRMSGDVPAALSAALEKLIPLVAKEAKSHNRLTVKARDVEETLVLAPLLFEP